MEYKKLSKEDTTKTSVFGVLGNAHISDISRIVLTKEEFLKGAKPNDLFESVQRRLQIAEWKEIYSKSFLVPNLCSEEEYNSIPASNIREMEHQRNRDYSILANQIVGSETY